MKKKRIILIGGNGFLASHLAKFFIKKKYKLIIFDKKFNKQKLKFVKYIKGDILKKSNIAKLLKKNDIVYHFAAVSDLDEAQKNHLKAIQVNIMGTVNILEACIKSKVSKLIFSSSIYARSEQGGFYSSTKLSSEMLIERYSKKFDLKYNILRFGSIYGTNSNNFNTIKNLITQGIKEKKIIRYTKGNEIRNYINVEDASKICAEISKKKYNNKYFDLLGKKKLKMKEVIKIISNELNIKKIKFIDNKKDENHYLINPYTYKLRKGINFKLHDQIDFLTGIKKIIKEIKSKKNNV